MNEHHYLKTLVRSWRSKAGDLDRFAPGAAAAFRTAASELDDAIGEADNEVITLKAAAARTGYTYSQLYRLVRSGKIEPVRGLGSAIRVRVGDLPRKPGRIDDE